MNVSELKSNYSIYGNKGNVWSNTAHIYKSGTGNLCGTPALATNWAGIENVQTIGCQACLDKYNGEANTMDPIQQLAQHMVDTAGSSYEDQAHQAFYSVYL